MDTEKVEKLAEEEYKQLLALYPQWWNSQGRQSKIRAIVKISKYYQKDYTLSYPRHCIIITDKE